MLRLIPGDPGKRLAEQEFMSNTKDDTGHEFSVRDPLAGGDAASPTPVISEDVPSSGVRGPVERGSLLPPLRRPLTAENMLKLVDWDKLGRGVMRRLWLIGLVTAVAVTLGLVGAVRAGRPKYDARASLLYRTDRQKQTLAASGSAVAIKGLARSTALSLLRRTSNLEAVRTNLNINMSVNDLRWRIQTKSERNSEIVILTVDEMPTADSAVNVVNELVRVALAGNRDLYRSQAIAAVEQFQRQALQARKELNVVSDQLTAFQATNRLLEAAADTAAFLDSVAVVSERLSAAKIAHDAQRVRIENYRKIIAGLPAEVVKDSFEDNPLKRRISNTEVALMEARTRYGPDNPRVKTLEDEIREMRRTLGDKTFDETRERVYEPNPAKRQFEQELLKLEAELSVLAQTVSQVSAERAEVEKRFAHLPRQQMVLAGFLQRRAAADDLCRVLEKSASEAKVAAELDLGDFELMEPARAATVTRSKMAVVLPFLALIFGLLGGALLCVALECLDPKLRTSRQVELAYTAPCLGAVAVTEAAGLADAFLPVCRSIYQRWGQPSVAEGARVLAVLSAQHGEGKSTLAFQIARYWAGLDVKTAYLDFDVGPNPVLNVPATQRGMEEYLADRAGWESVLFIRHNVACFKLMADAGDLPERLHGKAMARLMETLRANYGCVVIDTPAFLESRNAEMLARLADGAVWVIDSSRTSRATVNLAFDELDSAGIRPFGLVLNCVEPAQAGHGRG